MLITITHAVDGLAAGALYGVAGAAFLLSARFGTGWNAAIAGYASWAAVVAIFVARQTDLPFLFTLLAGMTAGATIALAVEAALLPLRRAAEARMFVVVAGIAAWIALDGLATAAVGTAGISFPPETYPTSAFGDDAAMLRMIAVLDIAALALVTFIVHRGLTATPIGLALRAHGFDPLAAALGGVHPLRIILLVAVCSGALAGLAGVLAAGAGGAVTAAVGVGLLGKGAAAALLGGGRIRRVALAGLAIGLGEATFSDTWPQFWPLIPWQGAAATLLLAVVVVRPRGLLATADMLGR